MQARDVRIVTTSLHEAPNTHLDPAPGVDRGGHDLGRGARAVEAPEGVDVAVVVGDHLVRGWWIVM